MQRVGFSSFAVEQRLHEHRMLTMCRTCCCRRSQNCCKLLTFTLCQLCLVSSAFSTFGWHVLRIVVLRRFRTDTNCIAQAYKTLCWLWQISQKRFRPNSVRSKLPRSDSITGSWCGVCQFGATIELLSANKSISQFFSVQRKVLFNFSPHYSPKFNSHRRSAIGNTKWTANTALNNPKMKLKIVDGFL